MDSPAALNGVIWRLLAGRLCSSIRQTSLETLLGAIGQSWLGVGSTEMAFIQENDIVCTEEAKINERSCYWEGGREEGRGASTSIACARLRSCITGNHIYCLSIRRPFSGGNYLAPVSLAGVKIAGPGAREFPPSSAAPMAITSITSPVDATLSRPIDRSF